MADRLFTGVDHFSVLEVIADAHQLA